MVRLCTDGVRRILDVLKMIEFQFPGSSPGVRVRDYKMRVFVDNVHEDMMEHLVDQKLFPGAYIQTQLDLDRFYTVTFHYDLAEISSALCGHLDVRRCWGLTRIDHWIAELAYFLGDTDDSPKPPPWYSTD